MRWPPAPDVPLIDTLVRAWYQSVFAPGRFFPQLGRPQSMWASLGYYMALGILVAGITLFWRMVLPLDAMAATGDFGPATPLLDFLFTPILLLVGLVIGGGIVHVLLLMFGGAHNGFTTTLRVFCFSYGPMLFGIVPIFGQMVGSVWGVVVSIIGLREAHGTSTGRAAAAVLVPVLIGMVLGFVAAVFLAQLGGMVY